MAKSRMTIWLDEKQVKNMKTMVQFEDFKNDSQFIGQAIEFYMGYLNTQNSTKYISNILLGEMQGLVNSSENRLKRLLVENLVGNETLTQIYAYDANWTDDDICNMRNEARKTIFKGGD